MSSPNPLINLRFFLTQKRLWRTRPATAKLLGLNRAIGAARAQSPQQSPFKWRANCSRSIAPTAPHWRNTKSVYWITKSILLMNKAPQKYTSYYFKPPGMQCKGERPLGAAWFLRRMFDCSWGASLGVRASKTPPPYPATFARSLTHTKMGDMRNFRIFKGIDAQCQLTLITKITIFWGSRDFEHETCSNEL